MEILIAIFGIIVLLSPGLGLLWIGLSEIIEEKRFLKNAIPTEGIVVGKIPVRFKSRELVGGFRPSGQMVTPETSGGHFLRIEYLVEGEQYSFRPRKVFNKDLDTVDVLYNKEDPYDVMVAGFYKVGNQKYFRVITGIILGAFPLAYLIFGLINKIF